MILLCRSATSTLASATTRAATTTDIAHRRLFATSSTTMSFSKPYSYILDSDLAGILKDKTKASSIAVVDVRDDDFVGGNIPGCQNIPSTEFPDKVQELVTSPLKDKEQVVFHCSLSQARGPKAARMYQEARDAAIKSGTLSPMLQSGKPQVVSVLRHGFAGFGQRYKADPALVENWDEESWKYR